jgi:uncharacterized membrane protein YdjX (TVP38/TMEM64 family)
MMGRVTVSGAWLRAAVLGLLLAAGPAVALTVDVRSWLDGAGSVALTLGVALVLLAPVPRTAVTVLVGVIAGFWAGLAIALVGGFLGALGAFGLSRALGRSFVVGIAGHWVNRVDRLLTERAFVSVLTGRLLPVVPFVALSYGAGLTGVRLAPYAVATALGLVPSTLLQVGLGASAAGVVDSAALLVVLPVVAVVVGAGVVGWRRRRPPVAA